MEQKIKKGMVKKVFLVEDDPLLIDIYTTKFKESGFEIKGADNGKTALRKMEEAKPDVVVLDIVLPYINGWEVLKLIRASKKLEGVKVLILSNLGQKEEIEKGIKLGANRYLIKAHFTPSQVVKEVQKLLESE